MSGKEGDDLGAVVRQVREALEERVKVGQRAEKYQKLVLDLKNSNDLGRLKCLFLALGNNAAHMSRHHSKFEDLLALLFIYDWSFGNDVSEAFESILKGLVSSHAGFLDPVFQLIVKNLCPKDPNEDDHEDDEDVYDSSDSEDENDEEEEGGGEGGKEKGKDTHIEEDEDAAAARLDRVHYALKCILAIIPLGCSTLLPVLISHFPGLGESAERQVGYVKQILRVSEYVPVIRDRILAVVVERLVQMDIEIHVGDLEAEGGKNQIDGKDGANNNNAGNEIFSMDVDDDDDDGNINKNDETKDEDQDGTGKEGEKQEQQQQQQTPADEKRLEEIKQLAEKLDQMMIVVLDYSDKQTNRGKRNSRLYFDLILNVFDRIILRTKSSKFTQFVLFYVCRKRSEFVDKLVERLLQRALENNDGPNNHVSDSINLNASTYLASFLARGLYIRSDSTLSALQHMLDWIQMYDANVKSNEHQYFAGHTILDPFIHLRFYAICQAVLYVPMFKGEKLEIEALKAMHWDVLLKSPLNPFAFVSQDIRKEFVLFASQKGLYSEQECNAIAAMDESDQSVTKDRNVHVSSVLADHYPFDPCLLRRTAERIEPYYQHWLSKQADDHLEEIQACASQVDQDEGEDENEMQQQVLQQQQQEQQQQQQQNSQNVGDQEMLTTTPVHIPGLSSRAARLLSQLGAGHGLLGNGTNTIDTPSSYENYFMAPSSYPSSVGSPLSTSPIHGGFLAPNGIHAAHRSSSFMSTSLRSTSVSSVGSHALVPNSAATSALMAHGLSLANSTSSAVTAARARVDSMESDASW